MVDVGHEKLSKVLIVEPFYGGSHKQLVGLLKKYLPECTLVTMTAKKWHWRARTAALSLADMIPSDEKYRALFCSSVLNLAELVALRPDLANLRKVVYFHENQLVYPVRKSQDRDFQYGYNQILTCLSADEIIFNSEFNKDSFLMSIKSFLKLMPDYRPKGLMEKIGNKSRVVYFPVDFESIRDNLSSNEKYEKLFFKFTNKNFESESERVDVSQSEKRKEELSCLLQKNCEPIELDQISTSCDEKHTKSCRQKGGDNSNLTHDDKDDCGDNFCVNTSDENTLIEFKQVDNDHNEIKICEPENTAKIVNVACKSDRREPVIAPQIQDGLKQSSLSCTSNMTLYQQNQGGSDSIQGQSTVMDNVMESDFVRGKPIVEPISQLQCGYCVEKSGPLHIVWAHRWEHDKDPETFLRVMMKLHNEGVNFKLSVLGEQFTDVPDVFTMAKEELSTKVANWGYLENKTEYYRVLSECDVAVSTALHEFFGVSMLEAVYLGCYPLCPNRLVYPEIYPKLCLYNTETQLYKRLRNFCLHPISARHHKIQFDLQRYHSSVILKQITDILYNT